MILMKTTSVACILSCTIHRNNISQVQGTATTLSVWVGSGLVAWLAGGSSGMKKRIDDGLPRMLG